MASDVLFCRYDIRLDKHCTKSITLNVQTHDQTHFGAFYIYWQEVYLVIGRYKLIQ